MKSICIALAMVGCGSAANSYNGHLEPPNELPPAIQVEAPDANLTPCVQGTWLLRFVPGECPLCSCQGVSIPSSTLVQIGNTIPVLNCEAQLANERCAYQADPKCQLMNGDQALLWNGQIVFQRFSGQIGNELFSNAEVGIGWVIPGGSHCPMTMLLTKTED